MSPARPLHGEELPEIHVRPPGPKSRAAAARLRQVEGSAIWGSGGEPPIVWARAKGSVVEDVDGNRYVDLTGGFGVASLGHSSPEVARAVAAQARRHAQGLGDLQPHAARAKLVRKLSSLGGPLRSVLLASTGSEAVELALKTVALATGRKRVVAFEGGYHGQIGAALDATHRPESPAALYSGDSPSSLRSGGSPRAIHIPYPDVARCAARGCPGCDLTCFERGWERLERELSGPDPPGAVLVEPVQGRAGIVIPPPSFLPRLKEKAVQAGLLLIADEILTGAGRTGPFWAWQRFGAAAEPDLMTAGKGLGGGVAIAALFGRPEIMEVWARHAEPGGESVYGTTYYAHPLACAGALAAVTRLQAAGVRASFDRAAAALASGLEQAAARHGLTARASGLAAALQLSGEGRAASLCRALAERGLLALPGGWNGEAITFLPAYTIAEAQLRRAMGILDESLAQMS